MEKPTYKLLLPFQGWCLQARGVHKHFRVRDFFVGFAEYKKLKNRTAIFCPFCDNNLIHSNSHFATMTCGWEHFTCRNCDRWSAWDFDAPAPLLMDKEPIKS